MRRSVSISLTWRAHFTGFRPCLCEKSFIEPCPTKHVSTWMNVSKGSAVAQSRCALFRRDYNCLRAIRMIVRNKTANLPVGSQKMMCSPLEHLFRQRDSCVWVMIHIHPFCPIFDVILSMHKIYERDWPSSMWGVVK